jgi:regulator of RNase E activity RraA
MYLMRTDTSPERSQPLSRETFEGIRQFDTCTIANAIETFRVRLRNEGFTRPGLHAMTGGSPRLVGYAATCRIRSSDPPMSGNAYFDRTDWWSAIGHLPIPRIAVIQDLEAEYGSGSTLGAITNGVVRDIPGVSRMKFPMFARSAAVSHAYAHLVDYGNPVEIFGLQIRCGDLLYADCHGVISIPVEIAEQIPRVAAEIHARERRIIDVCESPDFSQERLLEVIRSKP